jgi:hypothetical protein
MLAHPLSMMSPVNVLDCALAKPGDSINSAAILRRAFIIFYLPSRSGDDGFYRSDSNVIWMRSRILA